MCSLRVVPAEWQLEPFEVLRSDSRRRQHERRILLNVLKISRASQLNIGFMLGPIRVWTSRRESAQRR